MDVTDDVKARAAEIARLINEMPMKERVEALNAARMELHGASPFKTEPVDFVRWVPSEVVRANEYNPNSVAPPEMELLRLSIMADGYTQPIVGNLDGDGYEVVDGFHRNRVGKEMKDVRNRVHGYLPIVQIRESQMDVSDRMAATIRHNRARGKHKVEAMSEIVIELKRRNWTNKKIAEQLGMDDDEVLRLCQISGLTELFSDQGFSQSWDAEGEVTETDFEQISDDFDLDEVTVRTANTADDGRIFHTFDKWECYKAGFYATHFDGLTKAECEGRYAGFLGDDARFREALERVISEWKHSCEHYLTNSAMNRIAYLGQAAMCYATGIPSEYRGGFFLLTPAQQQRANETALEYLNAWLERNGRDAVTLDQATGGERQADIY